MTEPTPLYRWEEGEPELLGEPVLVACLNGWIDAGIGAAGAAAALLAEVDTKVIARFDTDELLDHRSRRPSLRIESGVNMGVTWPLLELHAARDASGTSFLLLSGPEPDHRWKAVADDIVTIADVLGVRQMIGLGAFPAPVPHTRACRLASTASTAELASEVGFIDATIEVPAGIQAVLEHRLSEAGIPAVGLWARVPHYVAAMPYPAASAALLDKLATFAGIRVDTSALHEAAEATSRRIDELVAGNEEHQAMVAQLEAAFDAELGGAGGPGATLPTGDEIAAELERFLREQRD
jgi:proteasome assembly chaperone (PAC2) family protein